MRRTKSVFLCTLLATLAFMPVKDNIIFAKEKAGVTIDVVDERYKYFLENAFITVKDSSDLIFQGTLEEVFSEGNIKLKDGINVEANNSKLIDLEVKISNDLDNRGQGIQNAFSLSIQYEYEDEINNGSGNLPNTGGFSNNNFMVFGVLALGIGASILKLPQKKEEI